MLLLGATCLPQAVPRASGDARLAVAFELRGRVSVRARITTPSQVQRLAVPCVSGVSIAPPCPWGRRVCALQVVVAVRSGRCACGAAPACQCVVRPATCSALPAPCLLFLRRVLVVITMHRSCAARLRVLAKVRGDAARWQRLVTICFPCASRLKWGAVGSHVSALRERHFLAMWPAWLCWSRCQGLG